MLWKKIQEKLKTLNNPYVLIGVLIGLFLVTRIPRLYNDNINPDGSNWHWRSEQFMNGIKYAQFEKTYQHYQPGVTLMWIIGPVVELPKQIFTQFNVYTPTTFPIFHYYSKLSLVFVQLILTVVSVYVLDKLIGFRKAILVAIILSLEPFFLGNSRMLHMDVLLSLFLFNGLLFSYWCLKDFDLWKAMFSGLFLGLSFLTKSVGVGGFLYVIGVGALYFLIKRDIKSAIKYSLPILIFSLASIFVFFPALWVDAPRVFKKILKAITGEGFGGHGEIFFGKYTRDPGWLFYPVVILIKSTPFLIVGFLIGIAKEVKKLVRRFDLDLELFLGIFYIGYVVVISIATKKIDRYVVPVYPCLAMLAGGGFLWSLRKKKGFVLSLSMFLGFVALPLLTFYPYYFTYTNPLFGSPEFVHRNILAQKPFGVGMFELKDYILDNYGLNCKEGLDFLPEDSTVCKTRYPRLAKWDTKPLRYVYDTDQLRITSYEDQDNFDVLVVAVDEEFPGRVLENDNRFVHDHSIYINGLEYWKIYLRARPDVEY